MKRLHLFEFEDLTWFPSRIRNYETDFLQYLSNQTGMWKVVLPVLSEGLKKTNSQTIIDIASGAGGGILSLSEELKKSFPELKIVLTDFYPNVNAFERIESLSTIIHGTRESVDARNIPANLKGLRTQFLSFHHFKPNDAQLILQNAVNTANGIAIFEAQNRSALSIFYMLLSPLSVLFTTPFIKPFSLGRIFFTYLVPIVPIVVCWDGIVSCLRTYSEKELRELIAKTQNHESFLWEIGNVKSGPVRIHYLLATKKHID